MKKTLSALFSLVAVGLLTGCQDVSDFVTDQKMVNCVGEHYPNASNVSYGRKQHVVIGQFALDATSNRQESLSVVLDTDDLNAPATLGVVTHTLSPLWYKGAGAHVDQAGRLRETDSLDPALGERVAVLRMCATKVLVEALH
jgi:hypothetical protein